jgi:hypothetical protein
MAIFMRKGKLQELSGSKGPKESVSILLCRNSVGGIPKLGYRDGKGNERNRESRRKEANAG